MKTTDEFAKESNPLSVGKSIVNTLSYNKGFKAGIELAQRWIPVEEELPENGIYLCKDEITDTCYLCHMRNGKFKLTIRTPVKSDGNCDGNMFCEDVTDIITHWRPIELK